MRSTLKLCTIKTKSVHYLWGRKQDVFSDSVALLNISTEKRQLSRGPSMNPKRKMNSESSISYCEQKTLH